MKIDVLTLFPEMFEDPFGTSMLKKAQDEGFVEIKIHNLRDWAEDKHKTVDDRPFGGGPGMILRVDVIDRALKNLRTVKLKNKNSTINHQSLTILLSAKGKTYTQQYAQKLSKFNHLILIAGHYEGVDERVADYLADENISIGNYVLTGGEIPAMVIVDSIVRLIPGVLKPESLENESFSPSTSYQLLATNLEYPQYTRPEIYRGWKVPEILLSGNHKEIVKWRREKSDGKH